MFLAFILARMPLNLVTNLHPLLILKSGSFASEQLERMDLESEKRYFSLPLSLSHIILQTQGIDS